MAELLIDRRSTLKLILGAGALTLTYPRTILAASADEAYLGDGMTVPLVKILPDNSAIICNPFADMGQGTSTGIPMMIAEELDLDWSRTTIEQLELKRHKNEKGDMQHTYIAQASGGSGSIRRSFAVLPKMAAQGRDMFIRAAAQRLGETPSAFRTEAGHIIHHTTGKRYPYASLLKEVAALRPRTDVKVKSRRDYRLIGQAQRIKAGPKIATGQPIFGIDQDMEGMVHAVIERCPHFGGRLKSVEDGRARAVPGVLDVVTIDQAAPEGPLPWQLVSSVAVIAKSFWAAKKARDLLDIEWTAGPFSGYASADTEALSLEMLQQDDAFDVVDYDGALRDEGDVDAALKEASLTHDATYIVRHVAHALMEPHSAIADVRKDSATVSLPCQHPYRVQDVAHEITGLPKENIRVEVSRSGGAFGRRWEKDYPAEAIYLSKAIGKPVKVTWTREDELTQDRYRNANHFRMTGGVDSDGRLTVLRHRQACGYPSLDPQKPIEVEWGYEDMMGWHFCAGLVKNQRLEQRFIHSPVPRGPWRAPGSVNSAFAQMCFLDELAHEAGIDPLEFQLSVLGEPRKLGPGPYPMDTGRMAACFKLAAQKAGWGKPLPKGRGRGVAGYFSHCSFVAHVVEVSVVDGWLTVEKVTSAADCGLVINPLSVEAQIEGAIHDGLSVALGQEITVANAAVQQRNFDSYEMARIDRSVRHVEIHLIEGAATPTGMGEPAMPPFAPALVNAIFAATGKRIRRLPIADQL